MLFVKLEGRVEVALGHPACKGIHFFKRSYNIFPEVEIKEYHHQKLHGRYGQDGYEQYILISVYLVCGFVADYHPGDHFSVLFKVKAGVAMFYRLVNAQRNVIRVFVKQIAVHIQNGIFQFIGILFFFAEIVDDGIFTFIYEHCVLMHGADSSDKSDTEHQLDGECQKNKSEKKLLSHKNLPAICAS